MGVRTLKLGEGFKAVLAELKIDSDQLKDALEYCIGDLLQTPEIFPQVPGLQIRRLKIPQYNLTIWFGHNDKTVELLDIEDADLLN